MENKRSLNDRAELGLLSSTDNGAKTGIFVAQLAHSLKNGFMIIESFLPSIYLQTLKNGISYMRPVFQSSIEPPIDRHSPKKNLRLEVHHCKSYRCKNFEACFCRISATSERVEAD